MCKPACMSRMQVSLALAAMWTLSASPYRMLNKPLSPQKRVNGFTFNQVFYGSHFLGYAGWGVPLNGQSIKCPIE
jgi:hypothetical protein